MGGESDYTLNRVVEYCDGWIPRAGPSFDPVEGMTRMHQAAEKVGRDPATLSMSVFRAPPEKQKLQAYAVAGVQRSLLRLPSADRDTVLKLLDEYAPLLS